MIERQVPDWIVLAAAYTDVDGCESHRDLAFAINCDGAVNVMREAIRRKARVIFLSTDYVFDGKQDRPYEIDDSPAPQSVYGESKAAAERQIREIYPDCCILRTSWVFGIGGKCFPDTILKLAATRKELEIVNDQRGCPTYTVDLARAIWQLCRRGAAGIVHATNTGDCTWFDFGSELVKASGLEVEVRPTTSDKFVRPAKRPEYSVLSSASLSQYGVVMPTWQDATRRYLAERDEKSAQRNQAR